jgi:hypothetical protein
MLGRILGEGYASRMLSVLWEHHCKGFSAPYRVLVASDVTEKTKRWVRAAMSEITTEKRDRLLLKIPGWPRFGFLSEILEGARFLHVVRYGTAVVSSQLNTYFWSGWSGPKNWSWERAIPRRKEEWDRYGQSFVVPAAIQQKILMDVMESATT